MTWLNKRVQNGTADISGITSLSTENTRLDAMNCKTVLHHFFDVKPMCVSEEKKGGKKKGKNKSTPLGDNRALSKLTSPKPLYMTPIHHWRRPLA